MRVPGVRRPSLRLLRRRHRPAVEIGLVVLTYLLYDSSRGLFGGGRVVAVRHAGQVVAIERWTSIGIERHLQSAAHSVPGLDRAFGLGYITLHLGATIAALVWLYLGRRAAPYANLRTGLVIASFVSLIGFACFPTAPPRLAGIGITDTVTRGTVNLNSSSLHWLYNPFAALPSVHIAYALLVGLSLMSFGTRVWLRVAGVLYPLWVAAEVIATGNHFVVDVLAGACVGAGSWLLAGRIVRPAAARFVRVVTAEVGVLEAPAAAA